MKTWSVADLIKFCQELNTVMKVKLMTLSSKVAPGRLTNNRLYECECEPFVFCALQSLLKQTTYGPLDTDISIANCI